MSNQNSASIPVNPITGEGSVNRAQDCLLPYELPSSHSDCSCCGYNFAFCSSDYLYRKLCFCCCFYDRGDIRMTELGKAPDQESNQDPSEYY